MKHKKVAKRKVIVSKAYDPSVKKRKDSKIFVKFSDVYG